MTTLLILLTAACPQTRMINRSKLPWVEYDRKEMKYAKKRCGEIYPGNGCLKSFYKLGFQDYFALCGKP